MALAFVYKAWLDMTLCGTDCLDVWRHARRRHPEEDGRTLHPVDVGLHGVTSARRNVLKTPVHLDIFMHKLSGPAPTIPEHALACRGFASMTGAVRAATIRAFARFCTPELDLAHSAQRAQGVSEAQCPALTWRPLRHQTPGCPLSPARMAKERGQGTPRSRRGGRQGERCRGDTAGLPSSDQDVPPGVYEGLRALFRSVAAIGADEHVPWSLGPDRVCAVYVAEVIHHEGMRGLRGQSMLSAIPLPRGGKRTKRKQYPVDEQAAMGPRMAEDLPCARMELRGVFRMQMCTMWAGTRDEQRHVPGQTLPGVQRFRPWCGLLRGEALSRRKRPRGMGLPPRTAW